MHEPEVYSTVIVVEYGDACLAYLLAVVAMEQKLQEGVGIALALIVCGKRQSWGIGLP